jgi:hypothetical protein
MKPLAIGYGLSAEVAAHIVPTVVENGLGEMAKDEIND